MDADQVGILRSALGALLQRFRECFATVNTFNHLERYVCGLMTDVERKCIEPIALAAKVPVRTLQEFLSHARWDEHRVHNILQQVVVDEYDCDHAVGIIDGCGHSKKGDKTPGVQRQWCGETGKIDNCIVGQHLVYTDNDPHNPFTCLLASDLFLPKSWDEDRPRCREAHIPDHVVHQPKWEIAIDQLAEAMGNGVRLSWVTFDEEYGMVPAFWRGLDTLGQRAIGEVPSNFYCWPTYPSCHSLQGPHAAKRVDNTCERSPVFRSKAWKRMRIKRTTRGYCEWELKAARVHLVDTTASESRPTDRKYWLIVARSTQGKKETKYFVSNASASCTLEQMMTAAWARWHVEKWFERAKQETGFGAFELRSYHGLLRHWLCSRIAMFFLAAETKRLRGKKQTDHVGAGQQNRPACRTQNLEIPLAVDHRHAQDPRVLPVA
jgi:SRSO17 transposase